jgi:hypothetical protein
MEQSGSCVRYEGTGAGMRSNFFTYENKLTGIKQLKFVYPRKDQMKEVLLTTGSSAAGGYGRCDHVIKKNHLTIPLSDSIYEFCRIADIPVKGEIPYDESVMDAVRMGKQVTEYELPAAKAIHTVWDNIVSTYIEGAYGAK